MQTLSRYRHLDKKRRPYLLKQVCSRRRSGSLYTRRQPSVLTGARHPNVRTARDRDLVYTLEKWNRSVNERRTLRSAGT